MEVNFKAQYINKVQVQKLNPKTKKFYPIDVNFIKISNNDKKDLNCLKKLASHWGICSLATTIYDNSIKSDLLSKTYAITTQNDGLEKLNYKKILGLAQIIDEKKDVCTLDSFEVLPKCQHCESSKNYDKLGTGLINGLKEVYQDKKINVNFAFTVLDFYYYNGFRHVGNVFSELFWKKEV